MKILGLLRHAKSDWDDMNQRDFDRGLNPRGRKGAQIIGAHIRDHGIKWDKLIASPAVRVKLTLDGAALEAAGRALRDAVAAIPASSVPDVQLAALVALRPHVDSYFDAGMVMSDDPALKAARLGLLRSIVDRFSTLADFSKLSSS